MLPTTTIPITCQTTIKNLWPYVTKAGQNQRLKECVKRAKTGIKLLEELSKKLLPMIRDGTNGKDNAKATKDHAVLDSMEVIAL